MNRLLWTNVKLIGFVGLLLSSAARAQTPFQVQFGPQGISSLQDAGQKLLVDGQLRLRARSVGMKSEKMPVTPPHVAFDMATKRLTQTYDWGMVTCTYHVGADRLDMDVEVANSAKQSIRSIEIALMRLKLPGWKEKGSWDNRWPKPTNPADEPQIIPVNYSTGTMVACNEDVDRAIGLHVLSDGAADEYAPVISDEGPPYMGSMIDAGYARHFHISLRFAAADASPWTVAPDIYKTFATAFPRQMKWTDRRPIGTLNLATSAMGLKKNPRGWFQDRTGVDVTTPAGIEAFHQRMLKHADACVGFAKDMNAQGIIVWDIEGQEMPHMISYIGDPRLMDTMAPEMSGVADAFMQKFKDAGLRVGVTIRPSHVVRSNGKHAWEHVPPDDFVEELSAKIEYARKRWGCTLFYTDSTVNWVSESDGSLGLKTMPAAYFKILNERFPDCLIMPEESATRYWAYTAPYHEVQQGWTATKPDIRAVYPDAFTVLRVVDSGIDVVRQKHDELVAGVKNGDILLYRTWFNDEYDAEVKRIYQDAGKSSANAASTHSFYVSPAGDDAKDGASPSTAWRTAAKVSATKFQVGDQILFQRGGDWHETLIASSDGSDSAPITYADYGDATSPKPTFWGSDIVPAGAFTSVAGSIYSFPLSALPTKHAYAVFADHQMLLPATTQSDLPAGSFFLSDSAVYVNIGADPRYSKTVLTASDRAQGTGADSSLICSNTHNHLVFKNLIGRETAAASTKDGVPDAYIFRIQNSDDVHLENCEAHFGGKHHFGIINSTGFVGTHLLATGCIPNLPYGHAGAFVSFCDSSRHGDTSQWLDCKVDHFDPNQQAFITHGAGIGNLLIQNLTAIGCGVAIGTDAPGEIVRITGGVVTGPTCDIYGTGVVVDGLHIGGSAKIDLFGNNNTVENCIDDGSTNDQGAIVIRGQGNIIRANNLTKHTRGPCINVMSSATGTQLSSNTCNPPSSP